MTDLMDKSIACTISRENGRYATMKDGPRPTHVALSAQNQ